MGIEEVTMIDTGGPFSPRMTVQELEKQAIRIRQDILDMIYVAQAGHPGGSLSAADIVTALYFRVMRLDPANPQWPDRDRFILSKGHACPVWYAALANRGFFDRAHLKTLRRLDSLLQGHADMKKTPGIDMTVGSLGQGICAAVGMALSARLQKRTYHVWTMVGDGEMQEGSVWEAALAGAKWKLDNLTVIIDVNGLQNDSYTRSVMPVEPVAEKWRAFGWHVLEIDGNRMSEVVAALECAQTIHGSPVAIAARTVKGKGVSFMENMPEWHGKAPDSAQFEQAMREVAAGLGGAA
jgi:transketolase